MSSTIDSPVRRPAQQRLEDLGTPLHDVTFVVLDLETTGGSPRDCRITEVGAVKIRHGERIGEFATLVDPGQPIPTEIAALTGITDVMVRRHPPIEAVLPTLLEFLCGAVLVAHNARFDTGFLNAALQRLDYPRLDNRVLCTAALARRLVRDEVRNCKLATLARHLRAGTEPTHRALADARATVDVFHALIERSGPFGVVTLEDLLEFSSARNAPLFASRAAMADPLPSVPGVYAFTSASGEVLYVGKATNLRTRVRHYFGNDDRRSIAQMIKETAAVKHWPTPTPIEAEAREIRLIHEHRPRFNRRSKHPQKSVWLKLTVERFPRLSIVRQPRGDGASYLGPIGSRRTAEQVTDAIHQATPIRRCTDRIGPSTRFAACALAEMGRCLAPCDGRITSERYQAAVAPVLAAFHGDPTHLAEALDAGMRDLADAGRFEEAAATRDRLRSLLMAVRRTRRLDWLALAGPVVAARRILRGPDAGGIEVVAIRSGRLTATQRIPPQQVRDVSERLYAEVAFGATTAQASSDESDVVARWLEQPGVTLLRCDGRMAQPVAGGSALHTVLSSLERARRHTGRPASELDAKRVRRA